MDEHLTVEHKNAQLTEDELALAKLGYKQEFIRYFSRFETFGLTFSIIGLIPSMASVLVFAVPSGGPVAMVWGWAVASIGVVLISLAMAELGSAAPTSGGLYYWTFQFASPRWRNLLCWLVGYLNTIGIAAGVASIDWGCAVQIMAAVSIGTDLAFVATLPQTFAVFTGIVLCHALLSGMATKIMARLQNVFAILHILLILSIIIGLPSATPKPFRNTAKFALTEFQNYNGWPNGYAFILSFLSPLWTIGDNYALQKLPSNHVLGGWDSSVHISEEARNASVTVPLTIITAPIVSAVLGIFVNMVLAFFMGTDLLSIVENPIGQPFATIMMNSFGKNGTLVIWSVIIFVQFFMGVSYLMTLSRQVFAFARDSALPFSNWIYYMSPVTRTPIHAVFFAATVAWCLGMLGLAGAQAVTAVFALAVVGQYMAYVIPISSRFAFQNSFKPGPFTLGKYGFPIAMLAVIWMLFMTVVFLFPTTPQTTASEMNYTIVVLGGWILLSISWYYFPKFGGVNWFKGPVRNVNTSEMSSITDSREKVHEADNA